MLKSEGPMMEPRVSRWRRGAAVPAVNDRRVDTALLVEFKVHIEQCLATLGRTNMRTLADLIAFNVRHCPKEMPFYGSRDRSSPARRISREDGSSDRESLDTVRRHRVAQAF
jgi:hypothetical protein